MFYTKYFLCAVTVIEAFTTTIHGFNTIELPLNHNGYMMTRMSNNGIE